MPENKHFKKKNNNYCHIPKCPFQVWKKGNWMIFHQMLLFQCNIEKIVNTKANMCQPTNCNCCHMVDKWIFEPKNTLLGSHHKIDELFITSLSKWLCIVHMYIKEYLMSFFIQRWNCYFEVKSLKDSLVTKTNLEMFYILDMEPYVYL
jgi:hypothetical protein